MLYDVLISAGGVDIAMGALTWPGPWKMKDIRTKDTGRTTDNRCCGDGLARISVSERWVEG